MNQENINSTSSKLEVLFKNFLFLLDNINSDDGLISDTMESFQTLEKCLKLIDKKFQEKETNTLPEYFENLDIEEDDPDYSPSEEDFTDEDFTYDSSDETEVKSN